MRSVNSSRGSVPAAAGAPAAVRAPGRADDPPQLCTVPLPTLDRHFRPHSAEPTAALRTAEVGAAPQLPGRAPLPDSDLPSRRQRLPRRCALCSVLCDMCSVVCALCSRRFAVLCDVQKRAAVAVSTAVRRVSDGRSDTQFRNAARRAARGTRGAAPQGAFSRAGPPPGAGGARSAAAA